MRIVLGTSLLLAATSLVGMTPSPVAAATGCDDPDTTWTGSSSMSWADETNWSAGVPTAASVVCIPAATTGPRVLEGTQAEAGVVELNGALAVAGNLDVATLESDFGELHGPGTTTVTGRLSGYWLEFRNAAVVDLRQQAVLGGEIHVYDGSTLDVEGDTVFEPGARVDSLSPNPGLFTVAPTGSLTFDSVHESAEVIGGFANHGTVKVTDGHVLMMGADTADAHPAQFSTGTFTAAPGATFNVSNTELRTGALLEQVTWVDHITVPAGETATLAASTLYWDPAESVPNLAGAGELVATDNTTVGGRIGGSLTLRVPVGEVGKIGDAVVQDQARVRVDGELQGADIYLNDEAVLDVYGVHRVLGGSGVVDFTGTDPGAEIIHHGGQLLTDPDGGIVVIAPFVNEGTVDSGTGFIYIGPRATSPAPSSGTFRAETAGVLCLGSNVEGDPPLALDQAAVEGAVWVTGEVQANNLDLRGDLRTEPGGSTTRAGTLQLTGDTTLTNGASLTGEVVVGGHLASDPGATGTATLNGAEVTGDVTALSGTLSVPSLAPTTLAADGTLTQGQWIAAYGATLDLPAVTTIDTTLILDDPGSSFGNGLASLTGVGPNGRLVLFGEDLAVPGPFRNEGTLFLDTGSRLDVGGKFRQLATGTLYTHLDSSGRGRVRAAGPRDLAGKLVVQRDPAYEPPVGTVLNFITSDGHRGMDDAFDSVVSPRYGSRKIRVDYGTDRVRLQVARVG